MLNIQYIEMAVEFLKTPFFQNRLEGLNALRYMCRFASSTYNNQSSYGMWNNNNNNNRWNAFDNSNNNTLDALHPRKLSETLTKARVVNILLQGDSVRGLTREFFQSHIYSNTGSLEQSPQILRSNTGTSRTLEEMSRDFDVSDQQRPFHGGTHIDVMGCCIAVTIT